MKLDSDEVETDKSDTPVTFFFFLDSLFLFIIWYSRSSKLDLSIFAFRGMSTWEFKICGHLYIQYYSNIKDSQRKG